MLVSERVRVHVNRDDLTRQEKELIEAGIQRSLGEAEEFLRSKLRDISPYLRLEWAVDG